MVKRPEKQTLIVVATAAPDPALAGLARVRKEGTRGDSSRYILEDTPTEIELTPYYHRRLRRGELTIIKAADAKKIKPDPKSPRRKPLEPVRDPFDTLEVRKVKE